MEIASKDLIGLPVFSLEEGEKLGQVRDLVIDPDKRAIVAIVIGIKKIFQEEKIVPFQRVRHIGPEALLLASAAHLEKKANFPHLLKLINRPIHITGNRVMNEDGLALGKVREFYADANTGILTNLELGDRFLSHLLKGRSFLAADRIVVFGSDVIILRDGKEPRRETKDYSEAVKAGMNKAFSTIKTKSKDIRVNFAKKDQNTEGPVVFPSLRPEGEGDGKEAPQTLEIKTVPAAEVDIPTARTEIVYQKEQNPSVE